MQYHPGYQHYVIDSRLFSRRLSERILGRREHFKPSRLQLLAHHKHFNPAKFSVGIVGTRRPTPYGTRFVRDLVTRLAPFDLQIISGGAMGIDAEAHQAALDNALPTQAWLVGPIRKPSPRSNWQLFSKILEDPRGAIVVPECLEPGPEAQPKKYQWLERNWWMVAACNALVVVEANMKSGTYESVRAAGELNVPAYLLPGSIYSDKSVGINEMLSMGYGNIIASVEFLVKTLIEQHKQEEYNNRCRFGAGGGSPELSTA